MSKLHYKSQAWISRAPLASYLRTSCTSNVPLHAVLLALAVVLSPTLSSCNRVDWVPIDDAIEPFERQSFSISGELCTSPSEDLSYPLRVLFVVDGSESMEVTDPPDPGTGQSGRQRAVREAWQRLLEQRLWCMIEDGLGSASMPRAHAYARKAL